MMTAIFLIGFFGFCVMICAFMAWRAPLGWEDDEGFHLGEPDE